MEKCNYGCGKKAKYTFKNGKHCCSKFTAQCPSVSTRAWKNRCDNGFRRYFGFYTGLNYTALKRSNMENKKHFVVGFAIDKKFESVLLIIKNRPEWQKGFINGIGGLIKKDEGPTEAMCREFEEEVGIYTTMKQWDLFCTLDNTPHNTIVYFFKTDSVNLLEANQITDEKPLILSKKYLPESMCVYNLIWLVDMAFSPFNIIANVIEE